MKMKKRMVILVSLLMGMLVFCTNGLAGEIPSIVINGNVLPGDLAPVTHADEVLLPFRTVAEVLGADLTWDGVTRQITLTKGDDVAVVIIGRSEATVNGKVVGLTHEPVIVEGHTFLPLELIQQIFGAETNWDKEKQQVSITFREYRDGLLPEEMLAKCNKAMSEIETYKYQGNMDMNILGVNPQEGQQNVSMSMDMKGQVRMPDESYVWMKYTSVSAPDFPQEMLAQPVETYVNKNIIYQRMFGGPWQKMDIEIPQELIDMNNNFKNASPQEYIEQIKQFGILPAYGGDEMIDDISYYVIKVGFDEDKYKEMMQVTMEMVQKQMAEQMEKETEGETTTPPDFEQTMKQIMDSMHMNYRYSMYINTNTYFMDHIGFDGMMTMDLPEQIELQNHFTGNMNIYDINQPVEMPEVEE